MDAQRGDSVAKQLTPQDAEPDALTAAQRRALWEALARALEMIAGGCQHGARTIRSLLKG